MVKCKYCLCDKLLKNGFVRNVQRYKCTHCGKNQVVGDKREKYDNSVRRTALAMYLNSCGIRSIGRVLNVPHQLVSKWVENAGKIIEHEILNLSMTQHEISILELDELYTYVQKSRSKHAYGWLLIGTETKLLRLTSEAEVGRMLASFTGKSTAIK